MVDPPRLTARSMNRPRSRTPSAQFTGTVSDNVDRGIRPRVAQARVGDLEHSEITQIVVAKISSGIDQDSHASNRLTLTAKQGIWPHCIRAEIEAREGFD